MKAKGNDRRLLVQSKWRKTDKKKKTSLGTTGFTRCSARLSISLWQCTLLGIVVGLCALGNTLLGIAVGVACSVTTQAGPSHGSRLVDM
jgi:Flp pilus assembly protein TadB